MLVLQEKQSCQHSSICPYNKNSQCQGANSSRNTVFSCSYADDNGIIKEDGYRNPLDKTGQMQIIMES